MLLLGLGVFVSVVMTLITIIAETSSNDGGGVEFEDGLSSVCPSCINGVVPAEDVTIADVSTGSVSYFLRAALDLSACIYVVPFTCKRGHVVCRLSFFSAQYPHLGRKTNAEFSRSGISPRTTHEYMKRSRKIAHSLLTLVCAMGGDPC